MIIKVHEAESGNDTLIDMPASEMFSQATEAIEGSFAGMEPDKEVELNIAGVTQMMQVKTAENVIKRLFDFLIEFAQKNEGFKFIEVDSAAGDHVEIIL